MKKIIYLFLILLLVLSSCGHNDIKESENFDESIFKEIQGGENNQLVDYKFTFGAKDIDNPIKIVVDNLEFELYINNAGKSAEFGVALCIDGYPQLATINENKSKIHIVQMQEKEKKSVKILINKKDLKLEKGNEHYIYPFFVLEPNFKPNSVNEIRHQGKISFNIPIKFNYEAEITEDVEIQSAKKMDSTFKNKFHINQEDISVKILSEELNKTFVKTSELNNKKINLSVVGNDYGKYKLFLVINNEVVKINDKDFYKFELARGMESSIEVDFDKTFHENDQLYFLLLPVDKESDSSEVYKTSTIYVRE